MRTIGRLYFYANDNPPKNVLNSYFFNIDNVGINQIL